jgi:hypothetical protein
MKAGSARGQPKQDDIPCLWQAQQSSRDSAICENERTLIFWSNSPLHGSFAINVHFLVALLLRTVQQILRKNFY